MSIELRFDTKNVDWQKASRIYELAPLGVREPDLLQKTFENSDLICFAWDGNELVGVARALSDGYVQSVIYDLCMLPEHQGCGLGKQMMQAMMARLKTRNIVLWAVPGKEGFYKKLGFHSMLTALAQVQNPQEQAAKGYIKLD